MNEAARHSACAHKSSSCAHCSNMPTQAHREARSARRRIIRVPASCTALPSDQCVRGSSIGPMAVSSKFTAGQDQVRARDADGGSKSTAKTRKRSRSSTIPCNACMTSFRAGRAHRQEAAFARAASRHTLAMGTRARLKEIEATTGGRDELGECVAALAKEPTRTRGWPKRHRGFGDAPMHQAWEA